MKHNVSNFDKKETFTINFINEFRREVNEYLIKIGKSPYDDEAELITKGSEQIYILKEHSTYEDVRKAICDEIGHVIFKYKFNEADIKVLVPKNINTLQRCYIQIMSVSLKFDLPLFYTYRCSKCGHRQKKKAYEVESTSTKTKCEGTFTFINGEGQPTS